MSRNDLEPLMTVAEVAEYLRISPRTVRNKVSRGEIPSVKLDGARRFRSSEIAAWVASKAPVALEPAA